MAKFTLKQAIELREIHADMKQNGFQDCDIWPSMTMAANMMNESVTIAELRNIVSVNGTVYNDGRMFDLPNRQERQEQLLKDWAATAKQLLKGGKTPQVLFDELERTTNVVTGIDWVDDETVDHDYDPQYDDDMSEFYSNDRGE